MAFNLLFKDKKLIPQIVVLFNKIIISFGGRLAAVFLWEIFDKIQRVKKCRWLIIMVNRNILCFVFEGRNQNISFFTYTRNYVSCQIIELKDSSGQQEQGIPPKNNNNSKAKMFVILLASLCSWWKSEIYGIDCGIAESIFLALGPSI